MAHLVKWALIGGSSGAILAALIGHVVHLRAQPRAQPRAQAQAQPQSQPRAQPQARPRAQPQPPAQASKYVAPSDLREALKRLEEYKDVDPATYNTIKDTAERMSALNYLVFVAKRADMPFMYKASRYKATVELCLQRIKTLLTKNSEVAPKYFEDDSSDLVKYMSNVAHNITQELSLKLGYSQ